MGFRFRKRIKVLPGLYWNIGGKKSSWSVKMGPVTKNLSSRGTRTTISARGTGMSFSSYKPNNRQHESQSLPPPPPKRSALFNVVFVFFVFFVVVVIASSSNVPTPNVSLPTRPNVDHPPAALPTSAATQPPPAPTVTVPMPKAIVATDTVKNSFMLDGKRIAGVTSAYPGPGGKVYIIYDVGGMTVSASTLPQDFLNAWKITPETLKMMGP